MLSERDDPIIAIATPPGRGAVGVVRISGKQLGPFVQQLVKRALKPRQSHLVTLHDTQGDTIDQVLAVFFPAPHSYTGEDVLELQGHGGAVVLNMLVSHCLFLAKDAPADQPASLPHLRMARPGEFTERAYLNDKLDLAQAEAVADLIDAQTQAAVRSAGRSLEGEFSRRVDELAQALVHVRMQIEACLDFPEEDLDFIEQMQVQQQLIQLKEKLHALMAQAQQGRLLRDGLKLVIAGQPNAGKSSLLNALAGADVAIVTPVAGTTRDVLTQTIHIEGVPVHVLDTAGLRDEADADEIERIGMTRAWSHIEQADLVVLLDDLSRQHDTLYIQAQARLQEKMERSRTAHTPLLTVHNKLDMASGNGKTGICISAKTGEGLDALRERVLSLVGWQAGLNEGVFTARTRHVDALRSTLQHVDQALAWLALPAPALDVLAEECRLAHQSLSTLTGKFTPDDLLGEIFSRFCIGK
ncbi:MAG: tRNA uridine-5-carboxymethylaminomethyl(34) synthesis GTPase MnmE [Pseudomonadota bacterium]|nr:tRNA uridine-5-carboxymethylaminomethyl(34) synthesis GTPase MnmE [Betaproteobacteria bacterium]